MVKRLNKITKTICYIFLFVAVKANAENTSNKHNYIESRYSLQFVGGDRRFQTIIDSFMGRSIVYENPNKGKYSLGIRKKGWGSISVDVPFLMGIKAPLVLDYDWYGERWGIQATYSKHTGFETKNDFVAQEGDGFKWEKEGEMYKRDDVEITRASVEGIYVFRKGDYSRGAVFAHSSKQIKSGWSPLLMGHVGYQKLAADFPLVPTDKTYIDLSQFKGDESYTLTLGGGLGGIYVWKTFYLGSEMMLSLGRTLRFPNDRDKYGFSSMSDLKVGMGLNDGKHGAGLNMIFRASGSQSRLTDVSQAYMATYLFYTLHIF